MQITTINKIISLFLVGSIVMLLLSVLLWQQIAYFFNTNSEILKAGATFLLSVFFLAAIALLGAIFEGLTDATVRLWLKRIGESQKLARVFLKTSEHHALMLWKRKFVEAIANHKVLPGSDEILEKSPNSLASSIFYSNASDSHLSWVTSHYATFVLVSNLIVVMLLGTPFLLISYWEKLSYLSLAFGTIGIGLAVYFLSVLAIDLYLYSYEVTFRYAYIWVLEKSKK